MEAAGSSGLRLRTRTKERAKKTMRRAVYLLLRSNAHWGRGGGSTPRETLNGHVCVSPMGEKEREHATVNTRGGGVIRPLNKA